MLASPVKREAIVHAAQGLARRVACQNSGHFLKIQACHRNFAPAPRVAFAGAYATHRRSTGEVSALRDNTVRPKMKKIGITSTGSVIVEMTTLEFDALQQLQVGGSRPAAKVVACTEITPKMNHAERSSYVAERLKKLSPKKKDGVIRSIEAMFQFGGGIDSSEVQKVISTLQRQKFFSITPQGRVTYAKG
ncbi:MAG: hypothetical protein EAZ84_12210 [Verrucomicrobia bacterium]|nr:MAG: hypothetical protein EAZ84_12210 [Verrucomicrobiota bacterium]TAE88766.1 MAG: hypothetical protein EAZ82_03445 [Verrucomicrobiota bacterium]TAF26567.1 MAG: hypothetical protein EAZ71_04970 [Verrucomicrobiota bacterium]